MEEEEGEEQEEGKTLWQYNENALSSLQETVLYGPKNHNELE